MDHVVHVAADNYAAVIEVLATDLKCISHVRHIERRLVFKKCVEIKGRGVEGSDSASRQRQQVPAPFRFTGPLFGCFFDYDMRIRAADAERADASAARSAVLCFPFRQLGIDKERTVCEVNAWVFVFEVETRWQLLVF